MVFRSKNKITKSKLYTINRRINGLKALFSTTYGICYSRGEEFYAVIKELSAFNLTSKKVLDIGAEGSPFSFIMAYIYQKTNFYLCDLRDMHISKEMLSRLKRIKNTSKISFYEKIRFQKIKDKFDFIYTISVLEHVPDGDDILFVKNLKNVLNENGVVCITVPFTADTKTRYIYRKLSNYESEYKDKKLLFLRAYSEKDIHKKIVKPSGLHLEKIEFYGEKKYSLMDKLLAKPYFRHPLKILLQQPFNYWLESIFFSKGACKDFYIKKANIVSDFALILLKKK